MDLAFWLNGAIGCGVGRGRSVQWWVMDGGIDARICSEEESTFPARPSLRCRTPGLGLRAFFEYNRNRLVRDRLV